MPPCLKISFYNPVNLSYKGGGEYWIIEVAKRLSARGHKVNVLTTRWSPSRRDNVNAALEGIDLKGINVIEKRYVYFLRGFAAPSPLDLSSLIKTFNKSDVVYFYVYPPNELMAWALKNKIHTPLIGGFHTFLAPKRFFLHRIYEPFFKKALHTFNGLHVLNSSTANLLKDWRLTNIYFIPNGVDTKIFELRKPLSTDTFNVLYTGRLTEDKGADILLKIIHYVNEKLGTNRIKFIICGFGPMRSLFEEAAKKYKNVEYLGFVHRDLLPNIYRNSHLFLLPSRSEGMPLRLLEAQSCGLPAIGSDIPGISDIIVNGRNGQLVKVGNIEGFAEFIKSYYELWRSSTAEYYNLNRRIRQHIVKNYDWNIIIDKLEKMFIQVLKCS